MSALREETVRFADAGVPGCFEAGCLVPGAAHRTVLERARSQRLAEQDSEG